MGEIMDEEASDQPPALSLPEDELYVLCHWACQALAEDLRITLDDAKAALEAAYNQDRVQILGNAWFAGVSCDDRWLVVEDRFRITEATYVWATLRHMEEELR
jgi:hypothetical protein